MLCAVCMLFAFARPSYAYTEEEIAQARAWLSAHGYSPDRGGAAAAYRDYLNGRFDDELGRNTTESTTESTTERTTEVTTGTTERENRTTEEDEIPDILLNPFPEDGFGEDSVTDEGNRETHQESNSSKGSENGKEQQNGETVKDTAMKDASKDAETVETDTKENIKTAETKEIEKEKKRQENKEVLLVIGISVGLMVIVELLLYMKSVS